MCIMFQYFTDRATYRSYVYKETTSSERIGIIFDKDNECFNFLLSTGKKKYYSSHISFYFIKSLQFQWNQRKNNASI